MGVRGAAWAARAAPARRQAAGGGRQRRKPYHARGRLLLPMRPRGAGGRVPRARDRQPRAAAQPIGSLKRISAWHAADPSWVWHRTARATAAPPRMHTAPQPLTPATHLCAVQEQFGGSWEAEKARAEARELQLMLDEVGRHSRLPPTAALAGQPAMLTLRYALCCTTRQAASCSLCTRPARRSTVAWQRRGRQKRRQKRTAPLCRLFWTPSSGWRTPCGRCGQWLVPHSAGLHCSVLHRCICSAAGYLVPPVAAWWGAPVIGVPVAVPQSQFAGGCCCCQGAGC